jgi:hypothetical protein
VELGEEKGAGSGIWQESKLINNREWKNSQKYVTSAA